MPKRPPSDTPLMTAGEARYFFNYDEHTGLLTWAVKRRGINFGSPAGWVDSRGYITITSKSISYQAHRIAWLIVHGKWPDSTIDHINGNPSDNRLDNLRDATYSENLANRRMHKRNPYGLKGVCYDKRRKRYFASICCNFKSKFLGYYDTPELAHEAYKVAAAENFGKFARTE